MMRRMVGDGENHHQKFLASLVGFCEEFVGVLERPLVPDAPSSVFRLWVFCLELPRTDDTVKAMTWKVFVNAAPFFTAGSKKNRGVACFFEVTGIGKRKGFLSVATLGKRSVGGIENEAFKRGERARR